MNLMKRAAQIRRKNKRLTVQQSVKKAAAEARAKKKGKRVGSTLLVNKGESTRKKPTRVYQVNRTKKGLFKSTTRISGIGSAMSALRGALAEKIGELEVRRFKATTMRDKKKIGKEIAALKAKYRKLK